jgi:hypothetical protein
MTAARLHLFAAIVYCLLAIPTVLWWSNSVLLVLVISLETAAATHAGAYLAARAKVEAARAARVPSEEQAPTP